MRDFLIKWGSWVIVAVLVIFLVLMNIINEQNITEIIEASRGVAQDLANQCLK